MNHKKAGGTQAAAGFINEKMTDKGRGQLSRNLAVGIKAGRQILTFLFIGGMGVIKF